MADFQNRLEREPDGNRLFKSIDGVSVQASKEHQCSPKKVLADPNFYTHFEIKPFESVALTVCRLIIPERYASEFMEVYYMVPATILQKVFDTIQAVKAARRIAEVD